MLLLRLKYLNSLLIVIVVTNAKKNSPKYDVANIPSHAISSRKCVTQKMPFDGDLHCWSVCSGLERTHKHPD